MCARCPPLDVLLCSRSLALRLAVSVFSRMFPVSPLPLSFPMYISLSHSPFALTLRRTHIFPLDMVKVFVFECFACVSARLDHDISLYLHRLYPFASLMLCQKIHAFSPHWINALCDRKRWVRLMTFRRIWIKWTRKTNRFCAISRHCVAYVGFIWTSLTMSRISVWDAHLWVIAFVIVRAHSNMAHGVEMSYVRLFRARANCEHGLACAPHES